MEKILWSPSEARRKESRMAAFARHVNSRRGLNLPEEEYAPLWEWSVAKREDFWSEVWDFFGVAGAKGSGRASDPGAMPGARFFADAEISFAENMLRNADSRPALISWTEKGRAGEMSRAEARTRALRLAGWLRNAGIRPGDAVAAYMPNIPETVVAMLGASAAGAVFSSCSMDFGPDSVAERLAQTAPKALFCSDGYAYGGRDISRMDAVAEIAARLPSLRKIVLAPFLDSDAAPPAGGCLWDEAAPFEEGSGEFWRGEFNAPLLALFSSGTTGAPKCILHGAGGTLLQHMKELGLHSDVRAGDKVFYFTTCGWMMWNWLSSALALEAAPVLYEGNPLHPGASALWEMAEAEGVSLFGASAKYFDALRQARFAPARPLPALRTICSTGSPLSHESFDYVYECIKPDVQLASISGGTDIVSCFALGNPLDPVRRGELQCRGLGMKVAVFDEDGRELTGEAGELVCTEPFPSMPLGFAGDEDGEKYRAAYFSHYPGAWRHGDWATLTSEGGMRIHGRSDATLNPGGVRIGAAEICRPAEALEEIAEAMAIGQEWRGDARVVLFVRLSEGSHLDEALREKIRGAVRRFASPRHAPAKIVAVADFPRTRSGKVSEIAAREAMHGRPVKNTDALANPESLGLFSDLAELSEE